MPSSERLSRGAWLEPRRLLVLLGGGPGRETPFRLKLLEVGPANGCPMPTMVCQLGKPGVLGVSRIDTTVYYLTQPHAYQMLAALQSH